MTQQSLVVMVEPLSFYGNPVTAVDNACQKLDDVLPSDSAAIEESSLAALEEHRAVVRRLREEFSVAVALYQLSDEVAEKRLLYVNKPDAIFPNNSISFHMMPGLPHTLRCVLYPMSEGRKDELPSTLLSRLAAMSEVWSTASPDFLLRVFVHDLRSQPRVLEGTGAVNFSHDGRFAYMSVSKRADASLFHELCDNIWGIAKGNRFVFTAHDNNGNVVYHTNVVGWVGRSMCGWCFDAMVVESDDEEQRFRRHVSETYSKVLSLSVDQMMAFAGNCLEITSSGGDKDEPLLCMSTTAWSALSSSQQELVDAHYGAHRVAKFSIPTIERLGGGSVRCLLASFSVPQELCEGLLLDLT